MRMSRFLYPANRKSSKRYESKTPNIRLRAPRKSIGRAPPASSALVDMIEMTSRTRNDSVLASSDGSLRVSSLRGTLRESRPSVLNDGFDGAMPAAALPNRPASIAVTTGVSDAGAGAFSRLALALRGGSGTGYDVTDSGWETDNATDTGTVSGPSPIDVRAHMLPTYASSTVTQTQSPGVASICIPPPRQRTGPFSAPLATTGSTAQQQQQQPLYYQPLTVVTGAKTGQQPERARPKSIRRMRANTASLECLSGSAPSGVSTLLRRRQHPMRGATSSDFKAVAGFSPGAAQRAKLIHHGVDASLSDLQSCSPSELVFSRSDVGLSSSGGGGECFAIPGKSLGKRSQLKRSAKECVIM
ncbi:hypothetical protein GGI21_003955 [Coemansia aciculifera]|nr:hypothetical protein GGI21_003955 [Coemansia aciculifera]